ncbi:TAXI family TRAP transporter solute-binding subunit [Shimia sp. Alg240-R146]|uniref:TAXI family TRAP transporter solute-binding subunit n=1 Tax=Shimia sp. Alg240-R146 TaxID=2993449 RepID=UPI0022E51AB7|nr:TAXI family TRAP transporter solute-binding subunit [Shimia sp. Alg240-R146]
MANLTCFDLPRRLVKAATCSAATLALALSVTLGAAPLAQAQEDVPVLTITTGGADGTYYKFAQEIQQMMPSDVPLEIATSEGSVQNLRRLIGYEGPSEQKFYQLAFVQADVLEQLRARAKGDAVLESIVDRIKVVMPLYGEEIHVFTRAKYNIPSIEALMEGDWDVNAGADKSGTNLTARWLYEQMGHAERTLNWGNSEVEPGLPFLGEGGYEVFFSVSGAPSEVGRSIQAGGDVTLLPVDLPELYSDRESPYRPAILSKLHYPWLDRDVRTMAVTALLVAFDYDVDNPYCTQIEKLTRNIVEGLDLRQSPNGGHPKWREVDPVSGHNRADSYTCSNAALAGKR